MMRSKISYDHWNFNNSRVGRREEENKEDFMSMTENENMRKLYRHFNHRGSDDLPTHHNASSKIKTHTRTPNPTSHHPLYNPNSTSK